MLLQIFVSLKKELIMKKILLGTTGLIGAALLATAANAETPKVTLGGFSDFQAGYVDDNDTGATATQPYGFRNDNEVSVRVDGKTDGGLGYGAEIDLEADVTGDADNQGLNASRTFTYLDGSWGRVELGSNKSAAATMRVDASTLAVATGGINGAWTYFVTGAPATGNGFISTSKLPSEHGSTYGFGDETTYNATKVSYYTPKYMGFQAGVSFTPQMADRGQLLGRSDATGESNIVDAGLSYENQFSGGVKLSVAATGEWSTGNGAAQSGTVLFGTDDISAYNIGALLGWKAFSLAGSYGNWDNSGIAGAGGNYWTAGVGYESGPIGLSATWLNSSLDDSVAGATNNFNNLVVGADYKLAPGLTPYAEVSFFDFDGGTTGTTYNNNGTSVILGTQVAF